VPEAAIYKNSNLFPRKEKVGNPQDVLVVERPTADGALNQDSLEPEFGCSIAKRANRPHILASGSGDNVFQPRHFQLV
jgi:hypothetical protein